ncbi:MAG: hypothetical protein ACRDNS_12365 [Trebonia sp.]
MPPATFASPELVDLFTTYTASADSIGAHLAQAAAAAAERHSLLVVTGTDLALYGGISDREFLNGLVPLGVCPLRLTGTDTDMLYTGAATRAERFLT